MVISRELSASEHFFTFNVKAKETRVHIRNERASQLIDKHYFAKCVGCYIQYVESRGLKLKKDWTLFRRISQLRRWQLLWSPPLGKSTNSVAQLSGVYSRIQ
jgi:hypothetical protein